MTVSIAIHMIGITVWLGTLMVLTRLMSLAGKSGLQDPRFGSALERVWVGFGIGGLVVTALTGLFQLFSGGVQFYMKQGWFHGKLTLVIVLIAVTFMLGAEIGRAKRGEAVRLNRLQILHGLSGLGLVVIILLMFVFRTQL